MIYGIIKSYKKAGLHRVSRRRIFEKSQNLERGVKLMFPSLELMLYLLYQAMKLLLKTSCLIFEEKQSICFMNDHSNVISIHFFIVIKLVQLLLFIIDRGPDCKHPAVGRGMFFYRPALGVRNSGTQNVQLNHKSI